MLFKQIKHRGDNFSYIIADEDTKEAAIVDPSFNTDVIVKLIKEQGLQVKYVIDTHQHWDHIAGNDNLRSTFNAKIVAHKLAKCFKDIDVLDSDIIKVGNIAIKVIHTPGHTPDSICLLVNGKLLAGDTLFVGECGRTDLPNGSAEDMYHSLFQKLMKLDDNIEVYPGHDYGPKPYSTIGIERKNNYTLRKRTLDEFIEFMQEP
ncbi:MBL fold metallo-hydrolase [Candidatus Bathyarchaeota archaeon]|nr:MBL fold metallo-hydrolase [Candidatus Bathyarchaeota archaeon]